MEEQIFEMVKKDLSRVFEMGLRQSPTDAENSEFYRPMIDLDIAPKLAKEITSHIREFHDWLEQDNTPNAFEKNYDYWLKNIKKC